MFALKYLLKIVNIPILKYSVFLFFVIHYECILLTNKKCESRHEQKRQQAK